MRIQALFRAVGLVGALVLGAGCASQRGARAGGPADQALNQEAQGFIEHRLQARPYWATEEGVHTYDAQLGDYSPRARAQELTWLDAFAAELPSKVKRAQLSPEARADYDVLQGQVALDRLELRERHVYELNPTVWLRLASRSVYPLIIRDFAPLPQRMRSVTARLNAWPALFEAARNSLARPPRMWTELSLEQLGGMNALLKTQLPEAFASVDDDAAKDAFQAALGQAKEALNDFAFYLRSEVLPASTGSFALGPPLYARLLLAEEGVSETPETLWAWGEGELAVTQKAFAEAARRVDPTKSPEAVFRALAEDHPPTEALLQDARATVETLRRFTDEHQLVTLPESTHTHLKVEATPRFYGGLSFASLDQPGALETQALDAFYYVTLPEPGWPAERTQQHLGFYNRSSLPIVTAHEVYPGHYAQRLHSREISSKVRRLFTSTAFTEGWGLYAEQLVVDAGLGDSPEQRARIQLAQLGLYLQRLARFRASLGLHTRGMKYEDAVRLFKTEAYMTQANAEREARRGTMDPMYLSYALGRRDLLRLREEVKAKEGRAFSLEKFHDRLLGLGQPPVAVARQLLLELP